MRTYEGMLTADGLRVAVVVSRFNGFVTEQLLSGALDALRRHGARDDDVEIVRVPGTFELAPAAQRLSRLGRYDAIVALGAVIRGATAHFDLIAGEAIKGLAQVALTSDCAVSFGVLTTDTLEQAIERAGTKAGNKGADAAVAAIEQANLLKALATPRAARAARG
ncbi:MAG TPA: 6,7-dimethyl-8-ribityllumazine synthase [Myxococcales bacterium]|nr:6,7-dimethyl-8-ribityllumazine synthase [Myxococcales bacterium]